jgi:hypothetical protein
MATAAGARRHGSEGEKHGLQALEVSKNFTKARAMKFRKKTKII